MRKIIAATDFSSNSENSVNYAAEMATVIGATLYIVHVYSIPIPVSEVPIPMVDAKQLEDDASTQLERLKNKIIERTGNRLHVQTILKNGNVIWEIEELCKEQQPYALVMGAESNGPVERMLFGGRTLSAISRFEWPVIVVPPGINFRKVKKIGLACDFRKVADTIPVAEIKDLINEFGAELHVLHVSMETEEDMNAQTVEESGTLRELIGDLNPQYHFIQDDNTDLAISKFADQFDLDLLIVVPKKHSVLGKLFEQSHSKKVVLHSHVPVMSIHE